MLSTFETKKPMSKLHALVLGEVPYSDDVRTRGEQDLLTS